VRQRARDQDVTFDNGTPVAELTPTRKGLHRRELAAVLAKNRLNDQEATAWRKDLQAARRALDAPRQVEIMVDADV
jgi:hypothetical protein